MPSARSEIVEEFIARYAEEVAVKEREVAEAWWSLSTEGTEDTRKRAVEAGLAYKEVFSDTQDFQKISDWHESIESLEPHVGRQVEILYNSFASAQGDKETLARLEDLEATANSVYSNHRAVISGEEASENEVRGILSTSKDEALRREAWESSKTVGREVEETVRELARLRNSIAREQGYRDHYHRSLVLQEIEPEELEGIMSGLQEATDGPFRAFKSDLDAHLKEKFGVEEVMPWHLSNPFFQSSKGEIAEMYSDETPDLDGLLADKDLEAITRKTYDNLGLEVRDVFSRSDLYERPGKDQHAFCIQVGREHPYDVRVLANVRPDHYWMDTLLHEFGHAVYDRYLDPMMPFFLRSVAHTNTTEAIALMMGSLADDSTWLSEVAGLPKEEVGGDALRRVNRLDKLVFVRWALVMYRFEQALYADPDRDDLNEVWWDLVEEIQLVKRPEGRDEPDWAAKIHVAVVPVYYHNYVIGELFATQLRAYIEENVSHGPFFLEEMSGRFLIEAVFGPGARDDWRETVERGTGEPLNPDYFVRSLA